MFHQDLNMISLPDLHNSLTFSFSFRLSNSSFVSCAYAEHQNIEIELGLFLVNSSILLRRFASAEEKTTLKFV